ncbi:MAG: type I-B CRISPR-associated protein Cas8b1/Cst1 [Candidatus Thorarchaeota archaeon]|nr:MAG: type I-B CRISPR-associated protein Cas8b1/Cst1 [Candidatus Thorarchaeota archaeon]
MTSRTRVSPPHAREAEFAFVFTQTGNPFVDSGVAALCELSNKDVPEEVTIDDVRKQLSYIFRLYSNRDWKKSIHGMIFPNADLVNPAYKDDRGLTKYKKYMLDMLKRITPPQNSGNCVACGRRDGVPVDKTRVPLLGSQKLVNFFPSGSSGERFCPACIIAVQFMLLSIEKVGIPLMMHCMNWRIQLANARRIMRWLKKQSAKKEGGLVELGYKMNAGLNAVYDAITEIIQDKRIGIDDPHDLAVPLRFYHFTNYGQGPQVNVHDIPSSVFEFLIEVERSRSRDAWRKIVRQGYGAARVGTDPSKSRPNSVYKSLTEMRSILPFFFIKKEQRIIGDWDLVSLYLRKVRRMSEKRIDVIREVADRILEFSKKSGSARRIREMWSAASYRDFRTALLKLHAAAAKRDGRGLLTYDEYTLDLSPEGGRTWRETRDLLMFRIFETGAPWLSGISEDDVPVNEGTKEEP